MNRKYIYFIMTFTILSFLLISFFFIGDTVKSQDVQNVQTANPRFQNYISGTGVIEPASGNILISSYSDRIIEKIYVAVNERVKKGQTLFQLYNQDLRANLKFKQKKYEESLLILNKLEALPREEDRIIAEETLNRAQALFNLSVAEYCASKRCARSKLQKCINWYKYQQAEAEFREAQAQFNKVCAGAWQPDLKIAQEAVEQAKADMEAMEREIDRTYIQAPIDGTILQIKIREGETSTPGKAAIILGNIEALNLRVSVDQFIASKFCRECPAVAFKQGDTVTEFPLRFLLLEPVMVPKKYLTNELHEKIDTQIFEILYRIEKNGSRLFIGEQMDVYINVDQGEPKGIETVSIMGGCKA